MKFTVLQNIRYESTSYETVQFDGMSKARYEVHVIISVSIKLRCWLLGRIRWIRSPRGWIEEDDSVMNICIWFNRLHSVKFVRSLATIVEDKYVK